MRQPSLRAAAVMVAAGALALVVSTPAWGAGSATAQCRGTQQLCEATFSLAGGASNKKLTVELPGTSFRLVGVNATPGHLHGAYLLTGGRFTTGGSVYTATLDAVQGIPRGAKLIMTFAMPNAGLKCGNIRNGVSFLAIFQLGSVRPGSFSCSEARTVGRTWLARFKAHQSVRSFRAGGILFSCRLVARLPQNMECTGGNLRVRFSGPTGL